MSRQTRVPFPHHHNGPHQTSRPPPSQKHKKEQLGKKLYLNVVGVWGWGRSTFHQIILYQHLPVNPALACLAQVPSATFSAEQECNRKINPCLMALRPRGSQLRGTRILIYNSSSKALKSLLQIPVAIRGWLHLARAGIKDFFYDNYLSEGRVCIFFLCEF